MATRYYPTVQVPNTIIDGPAAGDWATQSGFSSSWYRTQWTWILNTSKSNGGVSTARSFKTNQQGNYDMLFWRAMTRPLDAQTISGTFNLCFFVGSEWLDAIDPPSDDSHVVYKVHVYITVGQTAAVRHVLLDNYIDSVDWVDRNVAGNLWQSLVGAQAITSHDTEAGDSIMIEFGARIVSSPTPTPTYPPTNYTNIPIIGTGTTNGANVPGTDATAGSGDGTLIAWYEFSDTITEQAAPAAPANDACVDAIVIASLPYESSFIDTTQSADTSRAVWWKFTPASDMRVCFTNHGSNYGTTIDVYTGTCAGLTLFPSNIQYAQTLGSHRSQTSYLFDAETGVDYFIRVTNQATGNNAILSGGVCRLIGFEVIDVPAADDIYLPAGQALYVFRDNALIAIREIGEIVTGVAIDYTQFPMDDLNGGTNSNERVLVGLHLFNLVEVFDLPSLNVGETEIDFIDTPFEFGDTAHVAQLAVNPNDGLLFVGWFGNGYLFVIGAGTLPSILNTVSDNTDYSSLKRIPAIDGDNQLLAPFTATLFNLLPEITSPWAIALDATNGIIYYTSGGFYEPVGGELIKKFNVNTNTQLADFATVTLQAGNNPGIKGLQLLSDGGLLVCNSTVVERYDSLGAIVTTYTPSIPADAQTLVSVRLTSTSDSFWVVDLASTRLFKFDLDSGAELDTFQPYLIPGDLVQMDIYSSGSVVPPPPPPPPAQLSGIYQVVPGKTNDTLWADLDPEATVDVKIPDPFATTGLLGK